MAVSDMQIVNQQIFADGNVTVSPQELVALNNQPPQLFKASYNSSITNSGYSVYLSGYAQYIFEREDKIKLNFLGLQRSLNSLRAMPRPTNGFIKKGTVDTRLLKTNEFNIVYKIVSGQVQVFNIIINDAIAEARARSEKPALYKMKKNSSGFWRSDGKTQSVNTQYAAVNGQSNTFRKATWLMGEHLKTAYGDISEYTLYHNPSVTGVADSWESVKDKLGFTTDVTKRFSKVLVESQSADKDIKWVAHSQGAVIFAEGVRYTLNGGSSWAILGGFNGIFNKDKGHVLDKHSVTFHGNANNERRSKVLFERAGVNVLGYSSHPYDLVNNIVGMNASSVENFIGSIVYANLVVGGTPQQSPHTLPFKGMKNWNQQMENGLGNGRNRTQKAFKAVSNYLK